MKKIFIKFLMIFIGTIFVALNGYCTDIVLNRSLISDNANLLTDQVKTQLDDVLKNLHTETGSDVVIITINSLETNETFKIFEQNVREKYILGGENRDKWAMVVVTMNPYRMYINVGYGLKSVIPNSMKRALGMEFQFNRYFANNRDGRYRYMTQTNLYSTALIIAEAIADENNVRLHTSNQYYDFYGQRFVEEGINIPRTTDLMKFVRRYNIYPVIIIIIIGLFPFMFRRRRRRRYFNPYGYRQ